MNQNIKKFLLIFLLVFIGANVCFLILLNQDILARKTYNDILLFVNFGVLVTLFIKFAKNPLMDAIRGVREKHEEELGAVKKQHRATKTDLDAEEAKLQDIQKHLDEIRARIIEMGEKEKQKIIEQAKIAAERMVQDAKAYATFQMDKARKQLSEEMVDIAISMVEERLSKEISKKDNDKLISDFLVNLETTKPHLN